MISQDMFVRQLNMIKRSAKFILDNANIDELAKSKESSLEFLRHLNNLQLTFDNLLVNQNKYTLTEETKKCIKEVKSLKKQLDEFANSNWDVERLFVDKQKGTAGGS
jgi:predicted nuclease with TOPRIM domain